VFSGERRIPDSGLCQHWITVDTKVVQKLLTVSIRAQHAAWNGRPARDERAARPPDVETVQGWLDGGASFAFAFRARRRYWQPIFNQSSFNRLCGLQGVVSRIRSAASTRRG
jgi:hypothetical protein